MQEFGWLCIVHAHTHKQMHPEIILLTKYFPLLSWTGRDNHSHLLDLTPGKGKGLEARECIRSISALTTIERQTCLANKMVLAHLIALGLLVLYRFVIYTLSIEPSSIYPRCVSSGHTYFCFCQLSFIGFILFIGKKASGGLNYWWHTTYWFHIFFMPKANPRKVKKLKSKFMIYNMSEDVRRSPAHTPRTITWLLQELIHSAFPP